MSSNAKGKVFERKVVNIIRHTFKLSDKECYRTPISGGHPYIYKSDILFDKDIWDRVKLFIECKYRSKTKDWDFGKLIDTMLGESSNSMKWKPIEWLENTRQKCPAGYLPILVFGKSYSSIYVLVDISDIRQFILDKDFNSYIPLFSKYWLMYLDTFLIQWKRLYYEDNLSN